MANYLRKKAKLDGLVTEQIEAARADPELEGRGDVLAMLVLARDESGTGLTDAELLAELNTLLVAGHETTAAAIAWGAELLAHHPDVAAEAATGDADYVEALAKEVLRIRSPLPLGGARQMVAEFTIGPHTIPAGVPILVDSWGVHRDPEVYADPEAFRPTRFLDSPPESYAFLAFGGGDIGAWGPPLAARDKGCADADRRPLRAAPGPPRTGRPRAACDRAGARGWWSGHRQPSPQPVAHELARGVAGKPVDPHHRLWHLIARQPLAAEGQQLVVGHRPPLHDVGGHRLTPLGSGSPATAGVGDVGVGGPAPPPPHGGHVLASGDDESLIRPSTVNAPVAVKDAHVAGVQPAVAGAPPRATIGPRTRIWPPATRWPARRPEPAARGAPTGAGHRDLRAGLGHAVGRRARTDPRARAPSPAGHPAQTLPPGRTPSGRAPR